MSTQPAESSRGTSATDAFEIRDATVTDAEAIEAVHYASREAVYKGRVAEWPPRGPDRPGRIERWTEWLRDPEIDAIVATGDRGIVGFCTIRPSPEEWASDGGVAEMPTLYVHPDRFRRGLGRALCDAGLARAVELGYRQLTLWVLDVNTDARGFYEAYGFTADGTTKVDEGTTDRLVAHRYRISLPHAP